MRKHILLILVLTITSLYSNEKSEHLPKVLIIGDSISIGYTPIVKKELENKAIVTRHKGNAGPTIRAMKNIDQWLGDTKWDIIHFNWGLWDMYGWEYDKDDRSPEMYKMRLEKLVSRLKKSKAKLIWGTTTPVCPAPEKTMEKRFHKKVIISKENERAYLEAAEAVMKKHEIQINDLYNFINPDLKTYAIAPNDVHYTKDGYKKIGKRVADEINKVIDFKN